MRLTPDAPDAVSAPAAGAARARARRAPRDRLEKMTSCLWYRTAVIFKGSYSILEVTLTCKFFISIVLIDFYDRTPTTTIYPSAQT